MRNINVFVFFQYALFEALSQASLFPGYQDCSILRFYNFICHPKNHVSWFVAQHRVCCVQRSLCFCAAAELIVQVETFSREVTKIFLFRDLLNHWLVKMAESGKLRRIIGKYEKVRSKQQYFRAKYKYTIV